MNCNHDHYNDLLYFYFTYVIKHLANLQEFNWILVFYPHNKHQFGEFDKILTTGLGEWAER